MDYGIVTATFPRNNSPYTQIVSAQASTGTFTLVNPSSNTATAFLSSSQSGNPENNDDVPLPPGASVVLDGTADTFTYTNTPGTSAALYKLPSGSQYNSGSINIGTVAGNINVASVAGTVDVSLTGSNTVQISGTPTVDIGNTPSVNINGTPTVDIGTVSGSIDINSVAGSVNVAGAVNATGAGGFITPGQIASVYNNAGNLTVAANTISSIAQFNVTTYASIILSVSGITNSSVAAGAGVCGIIVLGWSDINGNVLATDTISCLVGGAATWEIPVRGSLLTLQIQNVGSVGTITFAATDLYIDGSFRVIPGIRVVSSAIQTTPVLTGCTVQTQGKPVYGINGWVANISYAYTVAVTNVVFPLALWCGEVAGFYDITTAALARNLTIVDLTYAVQGQVVSGSGYTFGTIISIPSAINPAVVPFTLNLPPTQCAVIADVTAGPGNLALALVGVAQL